MYTRPVQFVSIIRSQLSSTASCAGSSPSARPALLTRTSTSANAAGSDRTACSTASSSRTSSTIGRTEASPNSATSASSRSPRRAVATTLTPAAA